MKNVTMRYSIFFLIFLISSNLFGQKFDDFFNGKSLRVDYIFAGDTARQNIYLDKLSSSDEWAGRRDNLSKLPLKGNGDITVVDKLSGDTIYRTSFSSLFQEWLCEPEAAKVSRSYENSFLIPYPKRECIVTARLFDNHQKTISEFSHEINPNDILIENSDKKIALPHKYLLKSGTPENCIDVAILAEGYRVDEMELFYKDAQAAADAIFSHEPFKKYKDRFNVVAVASPSVDSGVSVPGKGVWKNSAFESHFNTFYSDRYLTTSNVKKIHDALSGISYEHIVILANTETYGGGGIYNSFTLTTAHHEMFAPVVVHEFGHSFAGLADEYAYDEAPSPVYPYSVEPWEQNITTKVDFGKKWKDMIDANVEGVGLYEGAGYTKKGIFRPANECRMKINETKAFCPVCQRAIERLIKFYTE